MRISGIVVALALAGCTSSPATRPGPAQMLADLDGDRQPTSVYQDALDTLASHCTQPEADLAAIAHSTLDDLKKNGIDDETELSVLQHLSESVPASQPTDCQGVAAAYLVLRESSR